MVNLRYHIVSITAVFLALGIGLTLGSSFLDRVTVDNLKERLDMVQERVEETRAENDALQSRVGALEQREQDLATELPERLLAGRLDAVPVLVIATEGTSESLVNQAVGALASAGADVAGTWWLTDRWALDDSDEVAELGAVLHLTSEDADRLRRNSAVRIAELLDIASQPAPALPAGPPVDPATDPASSVPVPTEPELVAALEDAGFIDYTALAGSGDERALLPGAAARYVMVSGAQPESGPALFASALLDEVVADGVAPVVAAQGAIDLRDADDKPAPEDARRTTFVGPVRNGELTRDRLSTVDDLDTAAGLAATVLAVEDLAALRTGHYGVAPGAARLLPGPDPET
ncbi:MAG: copper transporter [Acidimicrobiales bacterium]